MQAALPCGLLFSTSSASSAVSTRITDSTGPATPQSLARQVLTALRKGVSKSHRRYSLASPGRRRRSAAGSSARRSARAGRRSSCARRAAPPCPRPPPLRCSARSAPRCANAGSAFREATMQQVLEWSLRARAHPAASMIGPTSPTPEPGSSLDAASTMESRRGPVSPTRTSAEAAMHRWPAEPNAEVRMSLTTISWSQSGSATRWFFAPPSASTRLLIARQRCATISATREEPTKVTALMPGWSQRASTTGTAPLTICSTPCPQRPGGVSAEQGRQRGEVAPGESRRERRA